VRAVERVGFLGLGIMGSRMAANLRAAGFELTAWTHTPGKAQAWAQEHGAAAAATPAELAAASDVVISMVVDGPQVEAILLGDDGAVHRARDGALFVDMSTIAPADARRIGAALDDHGVAFLDAPVTGSSPRAEDGTLTIMVGGRAEDFQRAKPVLDVMGKLVLHVGALGHGQTIKVINNAVAAANAATLAQALVLASAAGTDLDALEQVLAAGSGGSAVSELKAGPMRRHDWSTLFKTAHMLKDVRFCLDEAEAAGVPFQAAAEAREALVAAMGRGLADADYASLLEGYEGLAGRRVDG
jgi:3-hydroxyisobutyrate dehydrogenase